MSDRFSRRVLLGGLGAGAAAALPLLQGGRARGAAAPAFPKRLVIVQTTNGVHARSFWPKVVHETDFALDSEVLHPIAPFKREILLLGGIEMRASLEDPIVTKSTTGHESIVNLLTGTQSAPSGVVAPDKLGYVWPIGNHVSIDQHIAQAIAKRVQLRFPSLELAVMNRSPLPIDKFMSYRAPRQGNTPENSPYKLLAALFSGAPAPMSDGAAVERLRRLQAERRSVLDSVSADLRLLALRLGPEDRMKIQAHLDSLRQVERELAPADGAAAAAAAAAGCRPPALPPGIDLWAMKNYGKVFEMQADLLVSALACDLTRVVTLMFSDSTSTAAHQKIFAPLLGPEFTDDHHAISHKMNDSAEHTRRKNRVEEWYFERFAYLLARLKSVPEGNGTLLDNTVVWWANHMSDGAGHQVRGMPWVLAGSCGGSFRTGRYLRFGDWAQESHASGRRFVPHNGLLVALANAMDAPTETFGNPKYGGQLPGLA